MEEDAFLGVQFYGKRMLPRRRLILRNRRNGIHLRCKSDPTIARDTWDGLLMYFRYYMISLMLGTVGLAYGSVPLYKMVRTLLVDSQFFMRRIH